MADKNKFSQEMQNYYDTLPAFIRQTIAQSASPLNDLSELRAFAEQIRRSRSEQTGES